MSQIKTMIFATDFSGVSANAQLYAGFMAEKIDAAIHLVHVFDPEALNMPAPYYFMPSVDEWIKKHTDEARHKAKELLDEVCRELGPSCTSHFVEGKPGPEIVGLAEKLDADMIVMGSHGYRGFSRLVLGSVTEYVLRHADCPVLAVKKEKED